MFDRHYYGLTVTLSELTLPAEVIVVWDYDEAAMDWLWFSPGWPESTLDTLEYCKIYDIIVIDECTWEIPQP